MVPIIQRLYNKRELIDCPDNTLSDKCWIYICPKTSLNRYGKIYYQNKYWKVHRLSYTLFKGPILKNL